MKEVESVRIIGAPNVGLNDPVWLFPECDIVKGCMGRSLIESFVFLEWKRGWSCDM